MHEVFVQPEGLLGASASSGSAAATVAAGAAAQAPPMTAVMPGTMSPAVVAGTARVIAHGTNKLAVSTLGAAVVAAVAEAYAENGIGYEVADLANAGSLTV
ncbi:hypothetical protein C1Y40_04791 [Mycobacterium talmoniae]|uniref:PE domain-containing protein n=1 Tax=Mycobacterium talmoniae TaxID=1858794 RepID=A0A2S8BEF7_9MYCO|nr:PE domain-containing protein [Mycobacterium eburneum]PQM45051.1 hypothetical protein C1Y40_04791 [Mycobacterium talmoniae]TDH48459.1 PE domain-containing protein [Mycobacterium eburneum]